MPVKLRSLDKEFPNVCNLALALDTNESILFVALDMSTNNSDLIFAPVYVFITPPPFYLIVIPFPCK